jgi:4-amino-4-deoxy-L-arabinose transferase-like glycosyltransferase
VRIAARLEGRLSRQVVGAAIAVFIALVLVAGPYFRSFDEAKYLGIGYSALTGNGPRTVFGAIFTPHAPVWPVVVAAPDLWFGIDGFAWGQFLNAMAGVGVLLLVGWFGWQIRPLVGALAVVAYLATPYFQDLTRTARLDVPAAFLLLAYLALGIDAVRRDSPWRSVAAGAVFAIAFLVKEIAVPLAPVPFLVAILIGRPYASIARRAAITTAIAAIGTSWWFVLFASYTHRVYRLGTSDRLLLPLYLAVAVLVVLGLAAPWLARRPEVQRLTVRLARTPPRGIAGRPRQLVAWGLAGAWFGTFAIFFERNPELKGIGLISPSQYRLYIETWLPNVGLPLVLLTLVGVVAGFAARLRLSPRAALWFDAVLLSLVCSAPLVMLVIAVGEPPRNYLAQIGLVLVIAATGWIAVGTAIARLPRSVLLGVGFVVGGAVVLGYGARASGQVPTVIGAAAGAALGLAIAWRWRPSDWGPLDPDRREGSPRTLARAPAVVIVVALLLSSAALGVHAIRTRQGPPGSPAAQAVDATARWIEGHVPAGTKIGFGSYLGYETAVELAGRNPMVQIHQTLAVVDPGAPLGLASFGRPPIEDWIAVDISRREREFYVFRASDFARAVIASRIAYYVYLTGPSTSVPALLVALRPEHGFTLMTSASFETVNVRGVRSVSEMSVFAVDPATVGFTGTPVVMSAEALDRLTGLLAADPATKPATAAALLARAVTYPDANAAVPFLDRLRAKARS